MCLEVRFRRRLIDMRLAPLPQGPSRVILESGGIIQCNASVSTAATRLAIQTWRLPSLFIESVLLQCHHEDVHLAREGFFFFNLMRPPGSHSIGHLGELSF